MRAIGCAFLIVALLPLGAWAETGQAIIQGTAEGSLVSGTATFTDTDAGLEIAVDVANVPVGKHAFHIHQFGSCADQGNAAGTHYNPKSLPHGDVMKDGVATVHAGDFGNMDVGAEGLGSAKVVVPGLTVSGGEFNVAGRAIILHEKEDDFGQPTGNAGARIGCGVITVTS